MQKVVLWVIILLIVLLLVSAGQPVLAGGTSNDEGWVQLLSLDDEDIWYAPYLL